MPDLGTRQKQNASQTHSPGKTASCSFSRDVGMTKRAVASMTFVSSSGQVQAANGTFSAFQVGDPIIVYGTNLNNGEHQVAGIDTVNGAYLVLDWPCKDEGPVTAELRAS